MSSFYAAINWSPSITSGSPFHTDPALSDILSDQRVGYRSPVIVAIHAALPLPIFTDRGKSAVALGWSEGQWLQDCLTRVTADWKKASDRRERDIRERGRQRAAREAAETAKRAAEEREKRARDQIVGTGILHQVVAEAAASVDSTINKLTVLSPASDPFRRDTRDGHAEGKWFAEQFGSVGAIHLRGLHYRMVVRFDVRKPDGTIYQNTDEDWVWLQQSAANNARWLGYIAFDRIIDERNAEPFIFVPEGPDVPGTGRLSASGAALTSPQAITYYPMITTVAAVAAQPYRLVMIGEKSSLRDVLHPIAQEFGAELLLPTGEPSTTMVFNMVARAAADGRPTKIFYFSDFDPSGWQMPISVSRKVQALAY